MLNFTRSVAAKTRKTDSIKLKTKGNQRKEKKQQEIG
jgi:hypothetical protein